MNQSITISFEGIGIIPAFDTVVILATGANSSAFFDFVGADSWEMGDKTITRAKADAFIDSPDNAYIAGVCGELNDAPFVWINEMRLTTSVIAEESQHLAQWICCENEISTSGEVCVELTHEATEAITVAVTDAGLAIRNDTVSEDVTEGPEAENKSNPTNMIPVSIDSIRNKVGSTILNQWGLPGWVFNGGFTQYSMDDQGGFHVMIFDDIGLWWNGINPAALVQALQISKASTVSLWINSPGGYINEAAAFRSILASCKLPVTVNLLGRNASAATWMGLFKDAIINMDEMGWQYIHHAQFNPYGDATTLRSVADVADMMDKQLFAAYGERCGMTGEEFMALVDSKEGRELYLSAQQCLEMGLVNKLGIDQMPMFKAAARVSDSYGRMNIPDAPKNVSVSPTNKSTKMDVNEKASLYDRIAALFGGSAPSPQNKAADPEPEKVDPLAEMQKRLDDLAASNKALADQLAAKNAADEEARKEADLARNLSRASRPDAGSKEGKEVSNPLNVEQSRWDSLPTGAKSVYEKFVADGLL